MNWRELETAAPAIARLGRERLDETSVALLATIRDDGSPRISPVEPCFARGHLIFGSMAWSPKTRELSRDPRCVLHSAITGPDRGEGELKLYGRATAADEQVGKSCRDGWWIAAPDAAVVFDLDIEEAAFVTWDLQRGWMRTRRWSPQLGYGETRRRYP